jgi:uncharacterized SAM-binding protein YcdF (DUF218 family)
MLGFWRRTWRVLSGAFAGVGFVFVAVSVTPLTNWWARELAGPWRDPTGDTLIVLGGSMVEDVLGESSYRRAVYAVHVFQEGGVQRIVVSGGGSGVPVSEAVKRFLVCAGAPERIVITEGRSLSTRENAVNTARLLAGDTGRKVLVTSDYHMFRAWRAFRKAGIATEPRPFPDAIKRSQHWLGRWPAFLGLCSETAKIGYYFVRGWI